MTTQNKALRLANSLDLEWANDALDYDTALNAAAELRRQASFINDLKDEIVEQCRLNGMSAEREDALRAEVERLNKIIDERKNKQHSLGYGEMELSLRRNHKDDLFECRRRFSAEEVMRGPDWLVEAAARSLDVQMNHAIQETENT